MKHHLLKAILLGAGLLTASLPALMSTSAVAQVVYNRGNSADPESLDPHKSSTVYEANIIRDLFEGLVAHDAKANVIPGAAESWTISPDGKVYTFKLRAGNVWSDGSPVTANDFVYSMRRAVNPETAAEYAAMLYPIVGAEEANKKTAPLESIGVKAIDANTLEVTLKNATPYFLEMLTLQVMFPVNEANVKKFGADWLKPGNMVSNGAYVLTANTPGDKITAVKNAKFHDAANVKIDTVNYFPTEDESAALKRFEAGEIDSNDNVPGDQVAYIKDKLKDKFFFGPYLGTYYYAVKFDKAPFNDKRLRRAISLLVDRDQLADKAWGNLMIPAYNMVPPGIAGYTSKGSDIASMAMIDREDEAKKLLAEMGISPEKPLKLEIRFNTSENHKNTAVAIADMMKPYGLEATLFNSDTKTHYGYLEQKGNYDLARAAWIADFKDPYTFLALSETGNGSNYSIYTNPAYDALLKQASSEGDAAKRMAILADAEAMTTEDISYIPLLYYSYKNLVSRKLKGFEQNVMDIHPTRFISKE
jgi:oligopeptide transport system substrate-binding protein